MLSPTTCLKFHLMVHNFIKLCYEIHRPNDIINFCIFTSLVGLTLKILVEENFGETYFMEHQDPFESDNLVVGAFKRWSPSAVQCHERNSECSGCYYKDFFKDRPYNCKMHLAVQQLLETVGDPPQPKGLRKKIV